MEQHVSINQTNIFYVKVFLYFPIISNVTTELNGRYYAIYNFVYEKNLAKITR